MKNFFTQRNILLISLVALITLIALFYFSASGKDSVAPERTHTRWSAATSSRESYQKPSELELRKMLTPLQFKVTQQEGTERPYANEYNENKAEGIYVDIVSGEPLFSSKDKYDSGTGWPSFVKPISDDFIILYEDNSLFVSRIEVRSRYAGSHLGHLFDDGPTDRGGKRYCINSAALRFIPKEKMAEEGYEEYLQFI